MVLPVGDFWYTGLTTGDSYLIIHFYSNGEFEYYIRWALPSSRILSFEEEYSGSYSVYNGKLTFTYKSARRSDTDTDWKYQSIALPPTISLPYELYEKRYENTDNWGNVTEIRILHYLKLLGGLPSVQVIPGYQFHVRNSNGQVTNTIRPDVPAADRSWTGKWKSNSEYWNDFDFTQNGNTVTGTFTEGNISGTVSGNILTINWEGDVYRFTMSPDGNKFSMEIYSSWGNTWKKYTLFEATRVSE
ncbi:MAG: hypothetical protein FWG09_01990 [Synergistaceae bacterium]|nr:hypothetical protein [Synergistaceae bacterium]